MLQNHFERRQDSETGTIMVDALVAVIIVSLMVALCLASLRISRHASAAARAERNARLALQTLVEVTPRTPGIYTGKAGTMPYSVTVTQQKTEGIRLCVLHAQIGQDSRIWRLEATRWCARETLS
jgi:hypothetical protein